MSFMQSPTTQMDGKREEKKVKTRGETRRREREWKELVKGREQEERGGKEAREDDKKERDTGEESVK